MATLVYSPGVRVHIMIANGSKLDVSGDLASGNLVVAENNVNEFNFVLNNKHRKYDGVFTPNDRIVVQMKRIKWIQVFSGYLNEVPFFSIYPRTVPLSASDTLKRIKYHPWDAGAPASYNLLHGGGSTDPSDARAMDGGLRTKTITLLTEVGGWPRQNIHIGALPTDWFDIVSKVQNKMADATATSFTANEIGAGADVAGGSSGILSGATTSVTGIGLGTGALPNLSGKCSTFGGPNGGAYGSMQLSGESGRNPGVPEDPRGDWYCAMRWPYSIMAAGRSAQQQNVPGVNQQAARNWWKQQRIAVTNPKTNKIVVVRPADWGPAVWTGRAIDLAPTAMKALGANTNDTLEFRFAPVDTPLGLIRTKGQISKAEKADQAAGGSAGSVAPARVVAADAHPITNIPTVQGASGLRFASRDRLKANVAAAYDFIKANWPGVKSIGGYANRGIAGSTAPSDHAFGLALDCMVNGGGVFATPEQRAVGNSIAMWFVANPGAFGTKYVIWQGRINGDTHKTEGWRTYDNNRYANDPTLGHYDHVHISFHETGQTTVGAMGGGWKGASPGDFTGSIGAGSAASPSGGSSDGGGGALLNTFQWAGQQDPFSAILGGARALMNDTALLSSVQDMVQASMRSYMAAPNGDFIAWFPDYFGLYGTAGKLHVADIELAGDGFSIIWSDTNLITHQFTAGSPTGYSEDGSAGVGGIVGQVEMLTTAGIATVEYPEIMEALFNVVPGEAAFKKYFDKDTVLKRFGARPDFQALGTITGPIAEFWFALYLFQKNWASQFSSEVDLTFMPEAWPGMLLVLDSFKFQAYIESVTHRFDFSEGGSFTTSLRIVAPSRLGGGLYGLPAGGGHAALKGKKPSKKSPPSTAKTPAPKKKAAAAPPVGKRSGKAF